jgi:PTS system mannose-specific IID component
VQLTRRDVFNSWWRWLFFSHANYNWERLQGTGFAHAMAPIIEKLYAGKPAEITAALKRHLAFFNTEPDVGGVIHGIVIAMEEQRAAGAPISDEAITNTKNGLMGPLAGLGDTIKQGLWIPIWLAFGISLAVSGNLAGPIIFFVAGAAFSWGLGWYLYYQGWKQGQTFVTNLLRGGLLENVQTVAMILGAGVLGALAAQFVNVTTPLVISAGQQTVNLQTDVLDKLMPKLLPLSLTLVIFWLLRRRVGALQIMVGIFVVTFVLKFIAYYFPALALL